MNPWLLRLWFVALSATAAHAQSTTITNTGDCRKHPGLCAGTHPLIREIESKAPPSSQVYQDMLLCRPLPLAMQADCIIERAKPHIVEKSPGVYEFVPPNDPSKLVQEAAEAQAKAEVEARKQQEEANRLQAEQRERELAAHTAAREKARQQEQTRLAARSPAEVEAERHNAAMQGERLKHISMAQVRQMMKDPDSARFGDTHVVFNRDRTRVLAICGTISGTNSYGARINGPWLFSTESDHLYIRDADGWKGAGLSLWSEHCS
jgi:hypothetical protein